MLWLQLDGEGALHRQLYRALRAAILAGRLAAGERLPGTPRCSPGSSASRATRCSRPASSWWPRATPPAARARAPSSPPAAGAGVRAAAAAPRARPARRPREPTPLGAGSPARAGGRARARIVEPRGRSRCPSTSATASLPMPIFRSRPGRGILGRRARRLSARRLAYQPPGGAAELREALAGYLARARGVVCAPEQIVIVHGSQQAIDLTARLLIDPGDRVVLEEPHYTGFSFCLNAVGAKLLHVPRGRAGPAHGRARVDRGRAARLRDAVAPVPDRRGALAAAAARAARMGDAPRRLRARRRLRRRVPLRRQADRVPAGARSRRQGSLRRHRFEAAVPGAAHRLAGGAARARAVLPERQGAGGHRHAVARAARAGRLHQRRAPRATRAPRARSARRRGARRCSRRSQTSSASARGCSARAPGCTCCSSSRSCPRARRRGCARACRERGVGVYPAAPFYAQPPAHAELLLGYAALSEQSIREGIGRLREALESL